MHQPDMSNKQGPENIQKQRGLDFETCPEIHSIQQSLLFNYFYFLKMYLGINYGKESSYETTFPDMDHRSKKNCQVAAVGLNHKSKNCQVTVVCLFD